MSTYDKTYFKQLKEIFNNEWRRIEPYRSRRKLTENLELLQEYRVNFTKAYNNLTEFTEANLLLAGSNEKLVLTEEQNKFLNRLKEGYSILGLNYDFTDNIFDRIIIENLTGLEEVETETDESFESVVHDTNRFEPYDDNIDLTLPQLHENETKMPQTSGEFLKLVGPLLTYKYKGDPLELDSFLADIDLVVSLSEAETTAICFTFIKSKLGSKPLEYMPDELTTVDQIKKALRDNIKPKTSKEVERDILSLKLKDNDFDKFNQRAEELAEAFKRSLVIEGITKAKALDMTISKTIDLCRANTRSGTAKSIIESSTYSSPGEVLSNFVIQNDKARKERDALELERLSKKNQRGTYKHGNSGHRGNNSNYRGNHNNGNNFNNNRNNNNNGSRNDNRNNNYGNGNYRGGSRGRGYQNRGYQNNGNRGGQGTNEHTIRLVTGNAQAPSGGGSYQSPQNQQENVFHIPLN